MTLSISRTILYSLLSVALISLWCAASETDKPTPETSAKHVLRYRLPQGARFDLAIETDREVSQAIPEGQAPTKSRQHVLLDATVQSLIQGESDIRLAYKERSYTSEGANFVDTADFSLLIGRQVEMMLSPLGRLSSFRSFEELPEIALMKERRMVNRQEYINDFMQMLPELPSAPVGVGDTWSYESQVYQRVLIGDLGVTMEMGYTVLADTVMAGLKCFKCAGQCTLQGRGQGIEPSSGVRLDIDLFGDGVDTMYFAYDRGMLLGSRSHLMIKGTAASMPLRFAMNLKYITSSSVTINLD